MSYFFAFVCLFLDRSHWPTSGWNGVSKANIWNAIMEGRCNTIKIKTKMFRFKMISVSFFKQAFLLDNILTIKYCQSNCFYFKFAKTGKFKIVTRCEYVIAKNRKLVSDRKSKLLFCQFLFSSLYFLELWHKILVKIATKSSFDIQFQMILLVLKII